MVQSSPAQPKLFATELASDGVIDQVLAALPSLPPLIRYYDDFDDKLYSIRDPALQDDFELVIQGRKIRLDFTRFARDYGLLLKHTFLFLLGENLTVSTAANYVIAASHLGRDDIVAIIQAGPLRIGAAWARLRAREMPLATSILVKALLRLLCRHRQGGWSDAYESYIRSTLPLPSHVSHAGVVSGDAFLSTDEEAVIVRYLDDIVVALDSAATVPISQENVRDAAMLLCAYQFAMRPIQIAMLNMRNVRIWSDDNGKTSTVHLTFHMAKQRTQSARHPLTRRVKREWAPIFVALRAHHRAAGTSDDAHFFAVQSAYDAGARIATLVRKLIGSDEHGNATDLRHTAAQRLVDAGASHEELAEFMGHSSTQTSLVYYATSASHAERVNRALGASDVYKRVARIAHDRFISVEELAHLKGDQQIAAVPHGVPIAGIGGCSSGQPACPYNPVTSCYGCRKFMPLHDKTIHGRVLVNMRDVVLFFERSSRGDVSSPAYMQLQRTIAEIQAVIAELESDPG